MDLSVVIVNWNTRELLLECLAAVQHAIASEASSAKFEAEIIVVDNGSCDGSAAAVRESDASVELIALPENRGYAAGNNAGLAVARGEIILLLNTDAFLEEGALRTVLDLFSAQAEIGAAGIQLIHPGGRLQNSIHAYPSFWQELVPRLMLEWLAPRRFPSKRFVHAVPVDVDAVLGAVFFVRRTVVAQIGALDEDYFFFLEETDWCWRIRQAGFRVVHVPDARAEHRSGASSKRPHPLETRVEFHRSLYRFLRVNRGTPTAAAVAALRVVKGVLILPFLLLLAIGSRRQRERLAMVWGMLVWHALGRPSQWGLSGVEFGPAPREV